MSGALNEQVQDSLCQLPVLSHVRAWDAEACVGNWTVVARKNPEMIAHKLIDEWDVPCLDELKAGSAGIALVTTQEALYQQSRAMRGTRRKPL